jgi:AAA+ ATPase superfamily predicted ATPase
MTTLHLHPEKIYTTDEVFGISRDLPLNYADRTNVDEKLIENLTRERHIVIYGSSKQGKTSLRKHCLQESDYTVVQCSNKWGIEDILANILKRAGFKITQSEKKTISGKNKILASLSASLFGVGSKIEGEKESSESAETTQAEFELDPSDVNDVIAALRTIDFNKYIVLEDFHYLSTEAQKDFSVALKAFHEASKICFIIVGVWLEENRLIVFNGDLTGRLIAIDADRWTESDCVA